MRLPFVVWDLDGTLIDSGDDIALAANAARVDMGLSPVPDDLVRSYVGEGAARLMERVMGEHVTADVKATALERFYVRYGDNLVVHTRPYPGIDQLVRKLKHRQAIATNKPGLFARRLVEMLGWHGCFHAIVGADEVARRKPAPDSVLRALELSGVSREEATFVGDSVIDIKTAAAAEIRFICVSWGLRPRRELLHAPVLVDTVEELEEALRR